MSGLPQILVEFMKKAKAFISRSKRGVVAIIIEDDTGDFNTKIYTRESDVEKTDYTSVDIDYISKVFLGNPSKVIVERISAGGEYDGALARLKNKTFNYLAVPGIASEDVSSIAAWIKLQRKEFKKTFKAVLPKITSDHEGIINFATDDIKVGDKTYSTAEYTARIAGILAGMPLSESCTYHALTEVESITESATPDEDIEAGKLILINDGSKIKIARGVNSLVHIAGDKTEDWKKIKTVDSMDMVSDDIRSTFEDNNVGKVINSYDNKIIFISAVNAYFKTLVKEGVLYDKYNNHAEIDVEETANWLSQRQNISEWADDDIKQANTGSNVFVMADIQWQDAMEDLKFKVFL